MAQFSRDSITSRVNWLEARGMDTQQILNLSTAKREIQQAYADWDLEKLQSIYDDRHDIVHGDQNPVGSIDYLDQVYEYFTHLGFSVAAQSLKVFDLLSDMAIGVMRGDVYEKMLQNSLKTGSDKNAG